MLRALAWAIRPLVLCVHARTHARMHARVHGWLSDDGPLQALFRAVSRFGCNDLNRLSQEVCASVCVSARLYLSVCLPACLPACLPL